MIEGESKKQRNLYRVALWALWVGMLAALTIWTSTDSAGWDVAVYRDAITALRAHHDPYADAIAVQVAAHAKGTIAANVDPPYSYVYAPVTLPLLKWIGREPFRWSGAAYWSLYGVAILLQLWVCLQLAETRERRWLLLLAPVAPFFPGLLANGTLLGGNVAYLLYAAVFAAALLAWRGKGWYLFYAAIFFSSCVKTPMLSLILIAPFTTRRQWVHTVMVAASAAAVFAAQSVMWPELFRHYLQAVNLQFQLNRDFGCSPAGLLSDTLFGLGLPFSLASMVCYAGYAIPTVLILFYLSEKYLEGLFSLEQWVPVLMVGVILLNPRLIEYDVAPIVLPLTLLVWRFLRSFTRRRTAVLSFGCFMLAANGVSLYSWSLRKFIDGPLIVGLFGVGCWKLWRFGSFRKDDMADASPRATSALTTLI